MATTPSQRQDEFGAEYEDFESADVHQLLARTGHWLELLLMDEGIAQDAMSLIYERVMGRPVPDTDWRALWDEGDEEMNPRRAQFMVALNSYAFWGVCPDLRTYAPIADDALAIESFVTQARVFLDAIPPNWGEVPNLTPTVVAAECRLRLDTGRDVTPEQLATLARVSLKSLRNLMTPKGGIADLRPNAAGEIPHAEAMRWLMARPSFKPSIWHEADDASEGGRSTAAPADLGEVVFVPVAKDGSRFDPETCLRGGGYTIGPKGAEEKVEDFREAVAQLARMPVPQWRRPNPQGHWGIVSGVGWQRKVLSETGNFEQVTV
jgi:hypothetical protein